MAVYSYKYEDLGGDHYRRSLTLDEQHIYGSSRHAVSKPAALVYGQEIELTPGDFDGEGHLVGGYSVLSTTDNTNSPYQYTITRGRKYYEISNHLGNVMSTLRDRKLPQESTGVIISFLPDVRTWQDYLPFGMLMYNRNGDDGEVGRYGYQGSEKTDEIAGAGNHYTTYFRELDVRLGKWWTTDPKGSTRPWLSPYSVNANNPILMIDPNGDKEYESMKAYRKETGQKKLGQGDWLTKDRTGNTDVWKNANTFNLRQEKGSQEYTSIEQRAGFYGWFQTATDAKGFETRWAGAASKVANAINELAHPTFIGMDATALADEMGYSSPEARSFAETGNRMIFEDVFPKLRNLYNGSPLTSDAAFNWDAMALSQEQNLIQPLYQNTSAFGLISASSKQILAGSTVLAKMKSIDIKPFPKNGNLMDVGQRWQYGMQGMGYPNTKITPSLMPNPGGSYTNGTMYKLFRKSGAGGSW